jgi:hypothetical protein
MVTAEADDLQLLDRATEKDSLPKLHDANA